MKEFFINPQHTIPLNFLSFNFEKDEHYNLEILILIKEVVSKGINLSPKLIAELAYVKNTAKVIDILKMITNQKKGVFLKTSFATKNNISDESILLLDAIEQINEYLNFKLFKFSINRKLLLNNSIDNEFKQRKNEIKFFSMNDFSMFIEDILYMPIVFGETHKNIIEEAFLNSISIDLKQNVKVKENLFNAYKIINNFEKYLLTSKDILRYALFVSSYTEKRIPKYFREFKVSTSHSKIIMKSLNKLKTKDAINDMYPHRNLWLSLINNIHGMSQKFHKFINAQFIFAELLSERNKYKRFNSLLGEANKNDYLKYIDLLSSKPGMLLRSLDEIIRKSSKSEFSFFLKRLSKIELNPKLVIDQINRLQWRSENDINIRHINIGTKIVKVEKYLDTLNSRRVKRVILILEDALMNHLHGKDLILFNEISISEDLNKYVIPTQIRENSVSQNGLIYGSGSRIKIPKDIKFIRLFVAWGVKNGKRTDVTEHFDIDLSAYTTHNRDGIKSASRVSFYNQEESYAIHSGDITQCHSFDPESDSIIDAEFIDIDVSTCTEEDIEQIIISNYIYGSNLDSKFNNVHAYAGLMFLDQVRVSNEQFINLDDAFIVFKLVGNKQFHMPFSFDFVNQELVVIDQYSNAHSGQGIDNLTEDMDQFEAMYFNAYKTKFTMMDFLKLYCESNGIVINSESENKVDIDFISSNFEKMISLFA